MTTASTTKTEIPRIETTVKQVVNERIARVIEVTGIDVQKNRYKAMRAIAFESFVQTIGAGKFHALIDAAVANIGSLPSGWRSKLGLSPRTSRPRPRGQRPPRPRFTDAPRRRR